MSEKRFSVGIRRKDNEVFYSFFDGDKPLDVDMIVDLLNELAEENEQLRMKLKGDDYIMVSEMLSNLRKTGICDGCKNKDKPVEWYLERGFSITGQICDRYEPE